jgi:hypothetical protein
MPLNSAAAAGISCCKQRSQQRRRPQFRQISFFAIGRWRWSEKQTTACEADNTRVTRRRLTGYLLDMTFFKINQLGCVAEA